MTKLSHEQRFLQYVPVRVIGECWLWQGFTVISGTGPRGRFFYMGKNQHASRVSYMLFVGPLTGGDEAAHTCDNGLCVNPSHLFKTDHAGNMADMACKGRSRSDSNSVSHKLTFEQVTQIKQRLANGESAPSIARDFNVTAQAIRYHKQ